MRRTLALTLLLPALIGQAQETKPDPAAKARRERLLDLYRNEAAGYVIFRDPARQEKVELRREPVYVWTNPIRGGEQDGAVFVWTCRGHAEAIGTFFSYPMTGPRNLHHELHSLSTSVLEVDRPGGAHDWKPKAPGVTLSTIPDAPTPAASPAQRMIQIRELTRDFSAFSVDHEEKRWDLRLLPQPLYRFESTDPDVLDGAVFAFVTNAGTDPEVILIVEARKPSGSASPTWHYALARFSDLTLTVKLKGKDVFTVPAIPHDTPEPDPTHRYRTFRDRRIPPIERDKP